MSKAQLDKLIKLIEKQGKEIENLKKQLEEKEEAAPENPADLELEDDIDDGWDLFGTDNEDYKINKMIRLYRNGGDAGCAAAERYIKQHFAPLKDSSAFIEYRPGLEEFQIIDKIKMKHHVGEYVDKVVDGDKVKIKWSSMDFINKRFTNRFFLACNVQKTETVYKENGRLYINTFRGFLHKTPKKFKNFSDTAKKGVSVVWSHIKKVWCSDNEDQFNFMKKCICKMVSGNKLHIGIFVKCIEGAGKSIISDFIMKKVIGQENCHVVLDPSCFCSGGFNNHVTGKLFLLLEEVPSATTSQWLCLYNSMKPWITNDVLEIKRKHKDSFNYQNIASIWIISNNKCINIGENDRRWFMPDVSSDFVGNPTYFKKIAAATNNDEVGEAFFFYCKEFYKTHCADFNEKDVTCHPQTKAKTEIVTENMHTLYQYVKNEYINKKKGISMLLKDFRIAYLEALYEDKRRIRDLKLHKYRRHDEISSQEITRKLGEIGVKTLRKTNGMTLIVSYEDLYLIYKKKKWLDEDDFNDDNIEDEDLLYLEPGMLEFASEENSSIIEI